jgi:hypothetical protein
MSEKVEDALEIEPGAYHDGDEEYDILSSLNDSEFGEYLDMLSQDSRTCIHNPTDDIFTVT